MLQNLLPTRTLVGLEWKLCRPIEVQIHLQRQIPRSGHLIHLRLEQARVKEGRFESCSLQSRSKCVRRSLRRRRATKRGLWAISAQTNLDDSEKFPKAPLRSSSNQTRARKCSQTYSLGSLSSFDRWPAHSGLQRASTSRRQRYHLPQVQADLSPWILLQKPRMACGHWDEA